MKICSSPAAVNIQFFSKYTLIFWKPLGFENVWDWDLKYHMIDTPLVSFWW